MRCLAFMSGCGRTLLVVGGLVALSWARPLRAQTTTGSVRGYVRDSSGGALAGANLEARNTATGAVRTATSEADGAYTFQGLVPAVYDIVVRHIGHTPQGRRVTVQIGATLTLDFALAAGAVQLEAVTVEATPVVEMRTSEVATNVSQQQIQALPTPSRNFLDLAGLAPGVQVSEDRVNGTGFRSFAAGGGSPNTVNVFVDGASLKNDLTGGGVAGQDASRGNPFPRNAIQEYRVITQNFKAEYQKASSAIITATTKSGTNVWTGNVQFDYQNKSLVALDTFQRRDGITKPDYTRSLPSISIGGPIQRDHIFFFGSYEGNYQNRDNLVTFTPPSGFASLDTVNLTQYNGSFTSPFRETLLFGKLTDNLNPHSSAELSFSNRHETDVRDFGGTNAFQEAVNFRQNLTTAILKHSYFNGAWLNEASIIYDRANRNPSPNEPGIAGRQFHYPTQTVTIGSNLSTQDFTQRRLGFRNDLTYTGMAGHVFKGGVTVDLVHYDIIKANNETPLFEYADTVGTNCWCRTSDTTGGQRLLGFGFRSPYQLTYATGIPGIKTNNNQIGAYLQDDWSPSQRLTLNLGIRWDYESRMINTDYVTPANVVSFLNAYNDSLAVPLDLNRYISNGNNRSPFLGAFQPRLGFSYGVDPENKTTVFGGFGIYYDRSIFDFSVDEIQKLTRPTYQVRFADPDSTPSGQYVQWQNSYLTADTTTLNALVKSTGLPEAFLIDNKMKPPMSKQWSLGVRHMLGASLVGSITYQGQRGTNLFTYNWANHTLRPDGSCCIDYNGLAAHGFANIIYSTEDGKTWYDAVSLDLNRPYRRSSARFGYGWGVTYTYAVRAVAGLDNLGDAAGSFPAAYPTAALVGKHDSNDGTDERHHVVANWIMDLPYLYGVQFSGLITLGSGGKLDIGCPARFCGPATYINGGFTPPHYSFLIPGKIWAYRRVDVRLRKDVPMSSGMQLGVTLDLFNLFNYDNFGCYNVDYGTPNPNLGKAGCVVSDPRRAQFGVAYNF